MDAPDIKSRFGTAVRTRRKQLGLSQEELAGRAGLHRTYVADIERGARNLSLANIEKLAHALGTTIPVLFASENAPNGAPTEILLVEDEANDIETTLRAFRNACLTNRVHVVRDGTQALDFLFASGSFSKRATEPLPELVLLDLKLPKLNGIEVLRRIKGDARTRSLHIVILTGSEWPKDFEECKRLGAETYIVKPVNFQRLSQVTPQLHLSWALVNEQPARRLEVTDQLEIKRKNA
jgi:CheY-like chemotaxis protein